MGLHARSFTTCLSFLLYEALSNVVLVQCETCHSSEQNKLWVFYGVIWSTRYELFVSGCFYYSSPVLSPQPHFLLYFSTLVLVLYWTF